MDHKFKENAAEFRQAQDNVFARIAKRYDLLCDIFSLYLHRYWKTKAAKYINAQNPGLILDVATGTGHVALRVFKRMARAKKEFRIIATDSCPEMLNIAKGKLHPSPKQISFEVMDAHTLKGIKSRSVDLVSCSLAMKICERKKVIKSSYRVLKPGGTFVCLEASHVKFGPLYWFYLKYMDWCLPIMGRLAMKGDASTFLYLLKGIHDFPDQKTFAKELQAEGFQNVNFKNLSFGAVALHFAQKP